MIDNEGKVMKTSMTINRVFVLSIGLLTSCGSRNNERAEPSLQQEPAKVGEVHVSSEQGDMEDAQSVVAAASLKSAEAEDTGAVEIKGETELMETTPVPQDTDDAVRAASDLESTPPVIATPLAADNQKTEIAARDFKVYDRLMKKARVCGKDADCVAAMKVNLCSDCKVMVNRKSQYLKRLEALETKYPDVDANFALQICNITYNCGRRPQGLCKAGQCETTTDEIDPECGSPSRFGVRW
jgi:hypothetical protein